MHKKIILVLILTLIFVKGTINVNASSLSLFNHNEIKLLDDGCGLLGDPEKEGSMAYYAQTAFNVFKYAGLVAVLVLTIKDFAQGIFSSDRELPKNLAKTMLTRFMLAAFLFFLPSLSSLILKLIGVYGDCGIN